MKIEAPVKGGFTAGLHIMLDVMFQHGSVTDRQLAERMRNEIDEECKNGRCIHMCTCVSIQLRTYTPFGVLIILKGQTKTFNNRVYTKMDKKLAGLKFGKSANKSVLQKKVDKFIQNYEYV